MSMLETWDEVKLRFMKGSCSGCHVCFCGPPSLRLRHGFMNTYDFECPVCAVLDPTRPTRNFLVDHTDDI